jgi:RHS repeat-associated protein
MTRPNGVNTNYAYDSLSRLLSVLHQNGASTIDGASYMLDAAGNRTSKTDQMAGVTSNYTYDPLYELKLVTQAANTTESYTYDSVGNRLSSLTATASSYNGSNQLTSNSNATYTYDNNGNTIGKTDSTGTTTYAWDFEDRLTIITLPGSGGAVTFKYDPFGRRIQKGFTYTTSTTITNYAYDGEDITDTTDGLGSVITRYALGQDIDEGLALQQGGVSNYYQADGLGSVTSLSNTSGAITQTYTFDSFGRQIASSGSLMNPIQYTGRESDFETGLDYYRARYYDPITGRFLNEDLAGFDGGTNLYEYVDNGPLGLSDPLGEMPKGKDKWYGRNDPDFHKWFHRCWKQAGDPDADKEGIEEAFQEWLRRNKPRGGSCGNPKPNCNQKTNFEYQMEEESNRYKEKFWKDILIGDFFVGVVGAAGALGWLEVPIIESIFKGGEGPKIPKPITEMPKPAPRLPLPLRPAA